MICLGSMKEGYLLIKNMCLGRTEFQVKSFDTKHGLKAAFIQYLNQALKYDVEVNLSGF